MPRVRDRDAIYGLAEQWRKRCLVGDGSLLWPDIEERTWTFENVDRFFDAFHGNPDVDSSKTFYVKLRQQLEGKSDSVYRITADIITIYSLFPTNWGAKSKKSQLVQLLDWWEHDSVDFTLLDEAFAAGLGNPGFLTGKYWHMVFDAAFARKIKTNGIDPYDFEAMTRASAEISGDYPHSSPAGNIILHLLFPERTEPISSDPMLDKIDSNLKEYCTVGGDRTERIFSIRENLSKELGKDYFMFWDPDIRPMWDTDKPKPVTSNGTSSIAGESGSPSLQDVAKRCYLPVKTIEEIESLIRQKKQIILEGPPGSGKTFVARLFARYLAGAPLDGEPDEHVEIVQFHQSYGYEDFVAGIRPVTSENGTLTYETRPGVFIEMCHRAARYPHETFVLIIDEINRGNLSRIFGELLYGLEYRDQPVRMQYPVLLGDETVQHLKIPDNLYLIGTMNSTDRSLAMIDYALRRRFYFWRLLPVVGGTAPVLERWLDAQSLDPATRARVLSSFIALNQQIGQRLGPDYQIGHSYLMMNDGQLGDPDALDRVWRHALEPLLREYFHTRHDAETQVAALRAQLFASGDSAPERSEMDNSSA